VTKLRPIAIYLPQFHPIPENDQWWGKGFTEWTNVTRATPRFKGHYQPHLPADLGFYDLRVPEVREEQARLAAAYGIEGFCYYHYWFTGRQVLERPLHEVLALGKPDFPFCLCWANENWTRNWDGDSGTSLLEQTYSEADDLAHIRYLCGVFSDPRYLKIDGKPVFLVYRTESFPDSRKTAAVWRQEARKQGFPDLYLIRVENFTPGIDPAGIGFDAAMGFQPDWRRLPPRKLPTRREEWFAPAEAKAWKRDRIYSYEAMVRNVSKQPPPPYKSFPCVFPMWDNSARRKTDAHVFYGSTPELYGRWLRETVRKFKPYSPGENLVFINAWNEWAEGNHLEPDQQWGNRYLEATREALQGTAS
jgi:lipopolysaccharide biosynthesis protein